MNKRNWGKWMVTYLSLILYSWSFQLIRPAYADRGTGFSLYLTLAFSLAMLNLAVWSIKPKVRPYDGLRRILFTLTDRYDRMKSKARR